MPIWVNHRNTLLSCSSCNSSQQQSSYYKYDNFFIHGTFSSPRCLGGCVYRYIFFTVSVDTVSAHHHLLSNDRHAPVIMDGLYSSFPMILNLNSIANFHDLSPCPRCGALLVILCLGLPQGSPGKIHLCLHLFSRHGRVNLHQAL
jgi:hypothetical protein